MRTKEFIQALAEDKIVAAIRAAEAGTSGEIRVFVSQGETADAVTAATAQFARLGMQRTQGRNGVLVFVAPRSQAFAVIGDTAIHEKCGPEFWSRVAEKMSARFRAGDFTAGVVAGISEAGEILARHFPRQADDQNELTDGIQQG